MSSPIDARDAVCDCGRLTVAAYPGKLLAGIRINAYDGGLNPNIDMSDLTLGKKKHGSSGDLRMGGKKRRTLQAGPDISGALALKPRSNSLRILRFRRERSVHWTRRNGRAAIIHRSNPNDVARVEQFTFICTPSQEEAGPTNNWAAPAEMYDKLDRLADGAMRGQDDVHCALPHGSARGRP